MLPEIKKNDVLNQIFNMRDIVVESCQAILMVNKAYYLSNFFMRKSR